jgi:inositol-phosphate phosphatase/L-galactose 1-phosphate phosphatase/histidinol-phosphatase
MSETCPDEFVEFGEILAETAAGPIRRYFQDPEAAPIERKPDGSCYTLADKEGEIVMREAIRARYPDHGIVGEEFAPENEEAEFVWVLDPVDGTNGFVTASPMFTTAIALRQGDQPILGIINSPILDWRWIGARGRPTTRDGREVRTRACAALADATLCCASPAYLRPADHDAFFEFAQAVGTAGYGSYTHAGGFVAQGLVDLLVEGTVSPHDYLAHLPIVEGAGGVVTNWEGDALGGYPVERLLVAGDPKLNELAVAQLANRGGGPDGPAVG